MEGWQVHGDAMAADEVVSPEVHLIESEDVSRDEVEPLTHIDRLVTSGPAGGVEKPGGDVEADDTVAGAGQLDGLAALPAAGVEHHERVGANVSGQLSSDQLLTYCIAHQAHAGKPRFYAGGESLRAVAHTGHCAQPRRSLLLTPSSIGQSGRAETDLSHSRAT